MEENIKINTIIRILGGLLSLMLLTIVMLSLLSILPMATYDVISSVIFLIIVAPVCIYGYISGKVLDNLPTFLVDAIKGKSLKDYK